MDSEGAIIGLLTIGVCLHFGFLVVIRWMEKAWLTPSAVFATFLSLAVFVNPLLTLILQLRAPVLLIDTLAEATWYSVLCFVALMAGYAVGGGKSTRSKSDAPSILRPLSSRSANLCVKISVVTLFTLHIVTLLLGGTFESPKGFDAYADSFVRRIGTLASAYSPLLLAVLLNGLSRDDEDSLLNQQPSSRSRNVMRSGDIRFFGLFFIAVLALCVAYFGRHAAITLLTYFVLSWHSRVGLRAKHFAGIAFALAILLAASSLKGLGIAPASVRMDDVAWTLSERVFSLPQLGASLGMSIAGQDVFTQTIDYVPAVEPYQYGRTYFDSFLALFRPRFLFGSYDNAELNTPAHWFLNWYAPNTEGHGYDFSMMAEVYMNFGPACWIFFLAIGVLIRKLSVAIRSSSSPWVVYAAVITITSLSLGVRSDSNTVLKGIFYNMVPLAGIHALIRLCTWRPRFLGGQGVRTPVTPGPMTAQEPPSAERTA